MDVSKDIAAAIEVLLAADQALKAAEEKFLLHTEAIGVVLKGIPGLPGDAPLSMPVWWPDQGEWWGYLAAERCRLAGDRSLTPLSTTILKYERQIKDALHARGK
jgi:hypothetical protein